MGIGGGKVDMCVLTLRVICSGRNGNNVFGHEDRTTVQMKG